MLKVGIRKVIESVLSGFRLVMSLKQRMQVIEVYSRFSVSMVSQIVVEVDCQVSGMVVMCQVVNGSSSNIVFSWLFSVVIWLFRLLCLLIQCCVRYVVRLQQVVVVRYSVMLLNSVVFGVIGLVWVSIVIFSRLISMFVVLVRVVCLWKLSMLMMMFIKGVVVLRIVLYLVGSICVVSENIRKGMLEFIVFSISVVLNFLLKDKGICISLISVSNLVLFSNMWLKVVGIVLSVGMVMCMNRKLLFQMVVSERRWNRLDRFIGILCGGCLVVFGFVVDLSLVLSCGYKGFYQLFFELRGLSRSGLW